MPLLMDSFNLMQSVTAPTHQKGHTLDLVLSSGCTVSNIEIRDVGVSDHFMILFDSMICCSPVSPPKPYSSARAINSTTATTFSNTFMLSHAPISASISSGSDIEE